jgi:GYF domain 2
MIHRSRGTTNLGIFSEEEVRAGLHSRRFAPSDIGWREGMGNWQPLSQFAEFVLFSAPPAQARSQPPSLTATATTRVGATEPLAIWSLVPTIVSLFSSVLSLVYQA